MARGCVLASAARGAARYLRDFSNLSGDFARSAGVGFAANG
jgi:hypothetical protein